MCERARRARLGAAALAGALLTGGAAAAPSVEVLPLPFPVTEFRAPGSHAARVLPSTQAGRRSGGLENAAVVWGPGGAAAIVPGPGGPRAVPLPHPGAEAFGERPADAIPGSRSQQARALQAHFGGSTGILAHGVFGEPVEASALVVRERGAVAPGAGVQRVPVGVSRIEAGPGAVFEDREPRLADLDRDGTPEILVVRSTPERGASLAVAGRRDGAWRIVAETPPIGRPNRWLNPAATADFDGDGRTDVALVRTPHIAGVLQLWSWEGGGLALKAEAPGYSNHAHGSSALSLAAVLERDGVPALALPTLDRAELALVGFRGGFREAWRVRLPSPALTGVAAIGTGADAALVVGLDDGRVAVVRP
jgi:hypothetical protein